MDGRAVRLFRTATRRLGAGEEEVSLAWAELYLPPENASAHSDDMTARERLHRALAGPIGGAWGGALVGLTEAALIAATAGPADEYWLFPYAVLSYGALGALLGAAAGMVAGLVGPRGWREAAAVAAIASALSITLLGTFVVRYHVIQRVFHETLANTSTVGLSVNLGILGACAVVGAAFAAFLRLAVARPHGLGLATGALAVIAAVTAVGAAAMAATTADAPAVRRTSPRAAGLPNIVLIIADTLRADAVAATTSANAAGGLRALANDGVTFPFAYAQSSWTRPSVATILTGLYPSQHGAIHKTSALPDGVTTLAEALRTRGYWTAGFVTNINVAPIFNFQQGFDEYTYLAPSFYFWATDSATRLAIYKGLRLVRERLLRNRIYVANYYQDARVVDDAVAAWLGERPPSPYFLLVHYMDPHDPFFTIPYDGTGVARVIDANPPAARRDEIRGLYDENVAYFDEFLEQLLRQLKARGDYDNTLIALVADHGEEFQDHGGWWHGTTLFEEQLHVPLLVKRPREPRPGSSDPRQAGTLDLLPTILAAADTPPPRDVRGHDLFGPLAPPGPLFAEQALEGNALTSLRMGRWKLITANPDNPRGLPEVALYDLAADPEELRNLAAEAPDRVEELRTEMVRVRAAIGGPPA